MEEIVRWGGTIGFDLYYPNHLVSQLSRPIPEPDETGGRQDVGETIIHYPPVPPLLDNIGFSSILLKSCQEAKRAHVLPIII
jgi:hypothetical protein